MFMETMEDKRHQNRDIFPVTIPMNRTLVNKIFRFDKFCILKAPNRLSIFVSKLRNIFIDKHL